MSMDKPGHKADKVRSYNPNKHPPTPERFSARSNLRKSAKRASHRA